jgi:hypothetical protein
MIFMIVNSVLHQNTDQEWSSDSTLHTYAIPLLFLIDIDIQMTYSMFWLILTYKWHTLCFDWYWHTNDILYWCYWYWHTNDILYWFDWYWHTITNDIIYCFEWNWHKNDILYWYWHTNDILHCLLFTFTCIIFSGVTSRFTCPVWCCKETRKQTKEQIW